MDVKTAIIKVKIKLSTKISNYNNKLSTKVEFSLV